MRRLLFPLLFVVALPTLSGAQTFSANTARQTSGATIALTSVTAGSTLVAAGHYFAGGLSITATGSQGDPTCVTETDGSHGTSVICYLCNAAAGTHTWTPSTTGERFVMAEITGAATSCFDGTTHTNSAGPGTSADSGGLTTTQANELLFGVIATAGFAGTTGVSPGTSGSCSWTGRLNADNATYASDGKIYLMSCSVSSTGTYNAVGTFDNNDWNAFVFGIKAPAGSTIPPNIAQTVRFPGE